MGILNQISLPDIQGTQAILLLLSLNRQSAVSVQMSSINPPFYTLLRSDQLKAVITNYLPFKAPIVEITITCLSPSFIHQPGA